MSRRARNLFAHFSTHTKLAFEASARQQFNMAYVNNRSLVDLLDIKKHKDTLLLDENIIILLSLIHFPSIIFFFIL